MSTLRKWRKRDEIPSRMEPGPTGERAIVPLEAVVALAAQRGAGRVAYTEGQTLTAEDFQQEQRYTPPMPSAEQEAEPEPPRWAMELLARADARTEHLLERLAQAERERADAERDVAIERHRRELAEAQAERERADAERLRAELATMRNPEPASGDAEGEEPRPVRWWGRRRKR